MIINADVLKAQLSAAFRIMEVTADEPDIERPSVTICFGPKPQDTHWEYDFTLSLKDTFRQDQAMPTDLVKDFYSRQVVKWVRGSMRPLDNYLPGPYNGVITLTPQGDGFIATIALNYYSEF
jgi:hypothetical protein